MTSDGVYIFDCEVFYIDWLFVFKEVITGTYTVIWNDNDQVLAFMQRNPFLGGFNNKHYDNYILKGVLADLSPREIKQINDAIIEYEVPGWKLPQLQNCTTNFDWFDLMDDSQEGTSLKGIEAHLGISIEETGVDFNINRELTEREKEITERYCKYDVDATEILYHLRQGYLDTKAAVGAKRGIPIRKALRDTNAKLTSKYLQAKQPLEPWTDEREYVYPDKLLREYIPQEVFDFFNRLYDKSIPDYMLFGGYDEKGKKYSGSELKFNIGDCKCTIAFGGIHGAIPNYVEDATETRSIRNKDVGSYYPSSMVKPLNDGREFGYCSRCIPSPQIFADTLNERFRAKKAGDKATANALKLVLNTTYGAMLNGKNGVGYNDLYDPLMGRSVCISGQLFLLELAMRVTAECETAKIIQLNTDGIMVSLDNSEDAKWQEITRDWEDRTGFTLEEDFIKRIVQKDVNNYVEVPIGCGEPKVKGTALVRGVLTNGNINFLKMGIPYQWDNISGSGFKINNSMVIVPRAIIDYFTDGISPEDTIYSCENILEFQIISKVGGKYSGCYQIVNDKKVPVQKVNRVYAVKDWNYGTIYKIHAVTGRAAKVPSLPKHCRVDNKNDMTIDAIDKKWYLRLAKETINAFLGIKPPKKNTRRINSLKKKSLALLN